MDQKKIARALGWFSIALGVTELVAPKQLCSLLGIDDHSKLIRTFGVREIGAGALGFRENPKKVALGSAIASVAAVTAVDFACAKAA